MNQDSQRPQRVLLALCGRQPASQQQAEASVRLAVKTQISFGLQAHIYHLQFFRRDVPGKILIQRLGNEDHPVGIPVHFPIPGGWKPGAVCPGKAAHVPHVGLAPQMGQIPAHANHSIIGVIQIEISRQRVIQPFCFKPVQHRGQQQLGGAEQILGRAVKHGTAGVVTGCVYRNPHCFAPLFQRRVFFRNQYAGRNSVLFPQARHQRQQRTVRPAADFSAVSDKEYLHEVAFLNKDLFVQSLFVQGHFK